MDDRQWEAIFETFLKLLNAKTIINSYLSRQRIIDVFCDYVAITKDISIFCNSFIADNLLIELIKFYFEHQEKREYRFSQLQSELHCFIACLWKDPSQEKFTSAKVEHMSLITKFVESILTDHMTCSKNLFEKIKHVIFCKDTETHKYRLALERSKNMMMHNNSYFALLEAFTDKSSWVFKNQFDVLAKLLHTNINKIATLDTFCSSNNTSFDATKEYINCIFTSFEDTLMRTNWYTSFCNASNGFNEHNVRTVCQESLL
jgi:hypothetical protein